MQPLTGTGLLQRAAQGLVLPSTGLSQHAGAAQCAWAVGSQSREMSSSGHAKGRPDRVGSRYGLKLRQQSPAAYNRMRAILGYYDLPTSSKIDEPAVDSVTISTLQTIKYLPLEDHLKRRLLCYKTLSLNRDLEGLHAQTRSFLKQLRPQEAKPAMPAFMMGKQQSAKPGP